MPEDRIKKICKIEYNGSPQFYFDKVNFAKKIKFYISRFFFKKNAAFFECKLFPEVSTPSKQIINFLDITPN